MRNREIREKAVQWAMDKRNFINNGSDHRVRNFVNEIMEKASKTEKAYFWEAIARESIKEIDG